MARRATGTIVPPKGRRQNWAIRFWAYGERHFLSLGRPEDGWNRQRAEDELATILADVRRGIWRPWAPSSTSPQPVPPFGEFAEEWFDGVSMEWRERTRVDCRWRLDSHLLPFFSGHQLSAITTKEVDRYRQGKVRERNQLEEAREREQAKPKAERERLPRPLSNGSINKTIRLLATILEQALEYGHIDRNPAKGRKRLLREPKPIRTYLQPEQVSALLKAASELDGLDHGRRQPLLATLVLAGLRISEALALRWQDVDLGEGRLWIAQAKTDAGVREVDLSPRLKEILAEHRRRTDYCSVGDFVFATGRGGRENPSNVRNRMLSTALDRANEELASCGGRIMRDITPHSLRRTFASLLFVAGADVPYAMAQMGHADPKMTLGIYAQVIASKRSYGATMDGLIDVH